MFVFGSHPACDDFSTRPKKNQQGCHRLFKSFPFLVTMHDDPSKMPLRNKKIAIATMHRYA